MIGCGIVAIMFETRKEKGQKTVQDFIDDGTVTEQGAYVRRKLSEVQTREEGEVMVREILKHTEKTSRTAYREMEEEAYALLDEYFPQKESVVVTQDTDEPEPLQKAA